MDAAPYRQNQYGFPYANSMLLSDDGTVYSWGYGSPDTCSGVTIDTYQFPENRKPKDIKHYDGASFALLEDGTVHAWGNNQAGVLGIGEEHQGLVSVTSQTVLSGVQIEHLDQLVLSSNMDRGYAIENGTLYAWGNNANGILGVGADAGNLVWTPQAVEMPEDSGAVRSVLTNRKGQTFALTQDGVLYGWGNNAGNTLGLSTGALNVVTQPTQILSDVKQVHLSDESVYAVMQDGSVQRWGVIRTGAFSGTETVSEPTVVA